MRIFKRVLTSGLFAAGVLGGLSTAAASTNKAPWPTCIGGEDVVQMSDGTCHCSDFDVTYSKATGCKQEKPITSHAGPTNNPSIQKPTQPLSATGSNAAGNGKVCVNGQQFVLSTEQHTWNTGGRRWSVSGPCQVDSGKQNGEVPLVPVYGVQPLNPPHGPTQQPKGSSGNTYSAIGVNNAAGYNITNTNTATNSGSNG